MGYQGYYQFLCKYGHYWEMDAYEAEFCDVSVSCPICKNPIVWWSLVDTTNDEGNPVNLEKLNERLSYICPMCKQIVVAIPERYKQPINAGHTINPFDYDIMSGHDSKREDDMDEQMFESTYGDSSRLPGD